MVGKVFKVWLGLMLMVASLKAQEHQFRMHSPLGNQSDLHPRVLLEAEDGLMYVGTENGLFRYDGVRLLPIVPTDSLLRSPITALHQAKNQVLWVGHASGAISFVEQDSLYGLEVEEGWPEAKITDLKIDRDQRLWIATYGEGLYFLHRNRLYNLSTDDGLGSREVYAMEMDELGRAWACTDQGIYWCEATGTEKQVQPFPLQEKLPDQIVQTLHLDRQGKMWIGTFDEGVCQVDQAGTQLKVIAGDPWRFGTINALQQVGKEVWMGTQRRGLVVLDMESMRIKRRLSGLRGSRPGRVMDLHLDGSGNLWVAGDREGLFSFNPFLGRISIESMQEQDQLSSIVVDEEAGIWLAHGRQFMRYHANQGQYQLDKAFQLPGNSQANIISLYRDPNGLIWLGTFGQGMFLFSPETEQFRQISSDHGLGNASVLSIAAHEGTLWLATLGGAFSLPIPPTFDSPVQCKPLENETQAKIGANYILKVFPDRKGRVWFTTDGQGIYWLENGEINSLPEAEGLANTIVYSLTDDAAGNLWFSAQDAGIYRFDGQNMRHFGREAGLRNLSISSLLADEHGRILAVHDGGIDLIDGSSLQISYLGQESGLQQLQPGINASFAAENGDIWIANGQSVIRYSPPPPDIQLAPQIVLEEVLIFLSDKVPATKTSFSFAENHLSFTYAGLWYQAPEQLSYQYKLEGYDLDWIETRDQRITYPRLPAGNYQFSVRAAINQQFELAPSTSYAFTVRRPYWQTIWFYLALLAGAGSLGYLFLKTREKRLQRRAQLEQEKMRFQFETLRNQVNPHFLFNSFNTLISIIEEHPQNAIAYVNRLSDLFRNMLTYREKTLISLEEELQLLDNYVYLQQQRYGGNLKVEMDLPPAYHAYLIPPLTLQMLLENAVKHNVISRRKPLTIKLFTRNDHHLVVHNPLQKKRKEVVSTKLGLENIRNRYELLRATPIEVIQTETYFEVEVPLIHQL
ncbi:MAG: two-component regulator propeller domain-containing protein [Bacteroidota bacterium]